MSELVRTPFGISRAALSTSWYGESVLSSEKAKQLELHMQKVAAIRPVPSEVKITLVDRSNRGVDGVEMEWVTEL